MGRAQRTQASLTLAPSPPPSQVQTITGKTCQIQCHPEDTIGDLKATVRGLETTDDYHRAKGKVLPVHDNPKWQDMIHVIPGAEKPVQVTRFLQPTRPLATGRTRTLGGTAKQTQPHNPTPWGLAPCP